MLEPQGRQLLLDALRPPPGFTFDEGIGTTFSLDLLALLTAPLAFTLFDAEDPAHPQVASSIEVLHSVRQYVGKLTVFCHASRVSVPKFILTQYAFLEETIVECQGRRRRLFHPKFWLLRFVNGNGERIFRLLCLTRNLTFANSWDTALVLEGVHAGSQPRNERLAQFVALLPEFAVRPPSDAVRTRVATLARDVENVKFNLPDGFTDLRFWPLGVDGAQEWPFDRVGQRLLVISPFLTAGCLDRFGTKLTDATLVSTRDDLMKLPYRPAAFKRYFVLHDAAIADFLDGEAADGAREAAQLNGLHAKCFVTERGNNAHVWTGSANATDAAFSGNVEFLTELVGPKRRFGLDAVLTPEKDDLRFGNLLTDADPIVATRKRDPDEEDLRQRVELARALLSEAELRANAQASADDRWTVTVSGKLSDPLPDGVSVWCWPLPASARRQRLDSQTLVSLTFPELPFDALSAFLACRLEARLAGHATDCQFVLTVPLDGVPSDRAERIVRSLIKDRAALMRFLFLLLSEDAEGLIGPDGPSIGPGEPWKWSHATQAGLFELLVRTLDQRPRRLDEIARLIDDVTRHETQDQMFPPGFLELWRTVWAARTDGPRV